ncbi:MAG: dTDP-glucose 4,6-dehydratase [Candidatus Marinimicrobia bacterium]|nr:dTDP-glucose 4,6-dehydratase [Candidatus Neomarinimicrobiota bacterium]|tara:strand:+ start:254 stop:1282 length:1029 start_codon:yes stop_codon:yes gene_type:complete
MNKKIFITGSCGFIGYNFWKKCQKLNLETFSVDKLSYYSNKQAFVDLSKEKAIEKIDISSSKIFRLIEKFSPDVVVNFAAESHVDRSIEQPSIFLNSNYLGVFNLLISIQKFMKKKKKKIKFIQISTDEVFGSLGRNDTPKKETDNYEPSSPYSATKAAADLLIKSWIKTYKFPAIILHPSNNYGPWQFPEKLIPLSILKIINNNKVPVYGSGKNIREWIFVDDCVEAILKVIDYGVIGESYNIGSSEQYTNIEIINHLIKRLKPNDYDNRKIIKFVEDRPGHDYRYNLNISKIKKELKWTPKFSLEQGLNLTVDWYLSNLDWLQKNKKIYGVSKRIGLDKQ